MHNILTNIIHISHFPKINHRLNIHLSLSGSLLLLLEFSCWLSHLPFSPYAPQISVRHFSILWLCPLGLFLKQDCECWLIERLVTSFERSSILFEEKSWSWKRKYCKQLFRSTKLKKSNMQRGEWGKVGRREKGPANKWKCKQIEINK